MDNRSCEQFVREN